jgi:hypothetical protein
MTVPIAIYLFALFALSAMLGIDLAKPHAGMCAACARHDEFMAQLRAAIFGLLIFVLVSELFDHLLPRPADVGYAERAILCGILAFCSVVLAMRMGYLLGKRYANRIWVLAH